MNKRANLFWFYWERFGILAILAVTLIVFSALTPRILSISNLLIVLSRSAIVGIPALGMTFAICSGGFDLSVGSVIGLSTCVWASAVPVIGIVPATLVTLAVGTLCGLISGLVITKLKIQTFVATLATSWIYTGAALVYTDGKKQMLNPNMNPEAKIFSQNVNIFDLQIQLAPLLMMLVVFTAGYLVYRYTRFGVYTRSIGSHQPSALTSGLPVDRTLTIVFMLTGMTASMSALITASQLMQGGSTLGAGSELDVITATILGGTALAGGKGNIWGTMVAAIMLALTRNGLNLLGMIEEHQRLIFGAILLLTVAINGIQELMKEARR